MKAMQINASLSHTNFNLNSSSCQLGRRASFRCRAISPLNPSNNTTTTTTTTTVDGSTEKNKLHLSNLDKLLQTKKQSADQDYLAQQHKPISRKKETTSRRSFHRVMEAAGGFNLDRIPFLPRPSNGFRVKDATSGPMSPGYLNRLQRLLSAASSDPSPRNHIANRWREFHGSNNWSGLLDPLDENLRREIVRYGEFVQAAYKHFDLEPAVTPPGGGVEMPSPDKFYKVTKGLYATSSIGMPKWVDEMAPEWMTQRSSRIGYVAVCDDKREIQRMGRRDIVISLRGTLTCLEWAENVRAQLVPLEKEEQEQSSQAAAQVSPEVECGFLNLFSTKLGGEPSLADSIVDEIRRLSKLYEGEALSITIVGHSLGAALAILAADHLANELETEEGLSLPPVAVFSFGGPRVGNQAFVDRVQSRKNVKVLRVVNAQDVVTRVPGMMVSEEVERTLREKGGERMAGVLDRGYAHVGVELRLETKMSPYLRPDADMACCHDLEAYLHLVDGFMASNCPFRENAKRSLGRLLSEQGSNVKKLYTMSSSSKVLESSSTMVDVRTEEGLSRSNSFQTV